MSLTQTGSGTLPRATATSMAGTLGSMRTAPVADPHWGVEASYNDQGSSAAQGSKVQSLKLKLLSGRGASTDPTTQQTLPRHLLRGAASPKTAATNVDLSNRSNTNAWFLGNLNAAAVKNRLVELSSFGKPGEFVVFRSEVEPSCYGMTVVDVAKSLRNFLIKPKGSEFCLRERSSVSFPSIVELVTDLVDGSFDSRMLNDDRGRLGVKLRYPVDVTSINAPGTRRDGEVVSNPLFSAFSVKPKADDGHAAHDFADEMDDEAAGYLSVDSNDNDDDDDDLDNFVNNAEVSGDNDKKETLLRTARELENMSLSRLHQAEALYEALYGEAPDGNPVAGVLGDSGERVRSIQRQIAIVSAGLRTKSEERSKLHSKRSRLEESFLVKQHELRSLVSSRLKTESAFANRKSHIAQLNELDQAIKTSLTKKNEALERLVLQLRAAEQSLVAKKAGLIKLSGEGHIRKAALQHDQTQISVLQDRLKTISAHLDNKQREYRRLRADLQSVQRLQKAEQQKQEDLSLREKVSQSQVEAARLRMADLKNQALAAESNVRSQQEAMYSLRGDQLQVISKLKSLGQSVASPERRSSNPLDEFLDHSFHQDYDKWMRGGAVRNQIYASSGNSNLDILREEARLASLQL